MSAAAWNACNVCPDAAGCASRRVCDRNNDKLDKCDDGAPCANRSTGCWNGGCIRRKAASQQQGPVTTARTYISGREIRCDECCTGDRCDDPTHVDRRTCRHCKGTGHIGWLVPTSPKAAVSETEIALRESVKMQSHYATLLNAHDGGQRMTFATADEWIARLKATGDL